MPSEILLVLDATTGQNAVNQARLFRKWQIFRHRA